MNLVKKTIIISGANLYEGGTFSILKDCLNFLNKNSHLDYEIIALVNDATSFVKYKNIKFIEFKKIRYSYFHRLFYEYIYYYYLSIKLKPFLWFSINDISSNIISERRVVYCHNPSPFRTLQVRDLLDQPKLFFFTIFYKYIYKINLKKNNYVIVQQNQIKEIFSKTFNLQLNKIITAIPNIDNFDIINFNINTSKDHKVFFFPTFPRPFKNIEVICDAILILRNQNLTNFEVIITIDGTENGYSSRIVNKYKYINQVKFIGSIKRESVFDYYNNVDYLLFPSKLETWGLPITEFKKLKKPMIVSNLSYALETVGKYDKVNFFNPDNPNELALHMMNYINCEFNFDETNQTIYNKPHANSWEQLFDYLLK